MNAISTIDAPATEMHLRWRITPLPLFLGLTTLALAVRLIGLGSRPLWLDEGYSAWFSAQTWHVLWTEVPNYEPHPPFYYSLLKLWRGAFGGSAIALRLSSVLIAVATIPVVIAASHELERLRPSGRPLFRAAIASFLVAASPMLVMLGQEARPYPLLIFAYALATWGLLRLLREFKASGPGSWKSWLALAAGTSLNLWAHGLGILYATCLAVALIPAWLKRPVGGDRIFRGAATALVILLIYAPCLAIILGRAGDWRGSGWLTWKPEMMLQLVSLYTVPIEVLTVGSAVAALVLILLTKRAIDDGMRISGWTAERALLLLWWGPPILAILISQLAIPVFLPRTLTPTLVPAYLALSGVLARLDSSRERAMLSAALCITLLPSSVAMGFRPATEEWNAVGAYLHREVQVGDRVWLYPNDSALPLREAGYADAEQGIPGNYPATAYKGPIRAGSPAVVSLTVAQAHQLAVKAARDNAAVIWLLTRQSAIFDPRGDVPRELAKVRRAGKMREWGYINVQPYYRR